MSATELLLDERSAPDSFKQPARVASTVQVRSTSQGRAARARATGHYRYVTAQAATGPRCERARRTNGSKTRSSRTDGQRSTRSKAGKGIETDRHRESMPRENADSITNPAVEGRAATRNCPRGHTSCLTKHDGETYPIAGVHDERKGLIDA